MADATLLSNNLGVRTRAPVAWSAIFAGTFAFVAVEATFGVLGAAIFASAANPNAAHPGTGMSLGMGIWTLILSIIALYVGGRTAGHLSGAIRKLEGMYYGLVMFGLSIVATIMIAGVVLTPAVSASTGTTVTTNGATVASMVSTGGWWLWITMLLGGIGAMLGGMNAVTEVRTPAEVRDIRDTNIRNAA